MIHCEFLWDLTTSTFRPSIAFDPRNQVSCTCHWDLYQLDYCEVSLKCCKQTADKCKQISWNHDSVFRKVLHAENNCWSQRSNDGCQKQEIRVLPLNSNCFLDFMRLYDIPSYDPNTYWPQFSADNCFEETLPLHHLFKKTPRNIKMSGTNTIFIAFKNYVSFWQRPWHINSFQSYKNTMKPLLPKIMIV